MDTLRLDRRAFTAGLGGIVLSFALSPDTAESAPAKLPGSLAGNPMLDAWLRINPDGTATVSTGKVELGQGIVTAMAQIAAEELDLSFEKIHIVSGDTAKTPDEGQTAGSQSIEYGGLAVRLASAEARAILVDLAAKKLGVAADTLKVADGFVSAPDGRKTGYGDLAGEVDLHREVTAKVAPKPPAQHKIVGRSLQRLDIPAKLYGWVSYVQDLRLPNMLHGRVVRPPRYDAKLDSVDEAKARAIKGVVAVVRDGSFLGVIAEREEQAIKARLALAESAKWSGGRELPDPERIDAYLRGLPSQDEAIGVKQAAVLASGGKRVEASYTKPYMAHASIGPSCALAQFAGDKLTVWTHTQGVFPLRHELAKGLKMDQAAIRCVHVPGSGCYGQNGADDVAMDAALLARAVNGRAVRLQWMRDDEFAWEPLGTAMSMHAAATISEDGRITHWDYEVWSSSHNMRPSNAKGTNLLAAQYLAEPQPASPPGKVPQPTGGGDRNAIPLYDFPNQRVMHHFIPAMPLRVSALRTLGAYGNVFALESFMDECALAAGADPVAFRLAHMTDPRAKAVIEAVAQKSGWKPGEQGDGRGRGFAFAKYKNLSVYVAIVAEVEVDRASGAVRVPRAYAAVDAGQIINPDGLINQIEGGMIQSTSWTLREHVRFDRERILSRDWSGYPILSIAEAPKVEVTLIDRPTEKSLGSGEGSQGPMAAAIANGFAHATGRRIRDVPLTPTRVKAALA